ncbi:MAG: aminotransferase class III-fold pyridoxal phosphate-dependent enzyme [Armatimonadota bacterium]|nr:aminotransferase class III-fold pyridoxal phosphate-dependent enzyme [Armatimonadota bacterium]
MNEVSALYEKHLNAGLVRLMKSVGLTATEAHAEGCIVVDEDGNEWLDCIAGFGALNFGHRHPKIVEAVRKQLDKMPLSSRILFSRLQAELAALLAEITP